MKLLCKILALFILVIISTLAFVSCVNNYDSEELQDPNKVKVTFIYTLDTSNSGAMSRATTNEGVFNEFYEKIKSGELVAPTYTLTFTEVNTGVVYTFNGVWGNHDLVTLNTGTYRIVGRSTADGDNIQEKCSFIFDEQIEIDATSDVIKLHANYDCFLLIFNNSQIGSLENYNGTALSSFFTYNNYKYAFVNDKLYNEAEKPNAYIGGKYIDDAEFKLPTGNLNFEKGKYYVYNNVSNEWLNSYEEGIMVLSADNNGRPVLSFMQKPANADEVGTFTTEELLTLNNEDIYFANNPIDMLHSDATVFIACQGGGATGDAPAIYYLNEKTFVVENMFTVPEYPTFKPTKILMPSSYAGYVLPFSMLSEDGKMYNFSVTNAAVEPSQKLAYTYSQATHFDDGGGRYAMVVWDKDAKALANLYNGGYGPFYMSTERHLSRTNENFSSLNYFAGKEFVTMVTIRASAEQIKLDGYEVIVLTKKDKMYYRSIIESCFWGKYDTGFILLDNGGFSMIGPNELFIDENTPCIASKTYLSMFYAEGNKVRKWNYTTTQQITAATTHLTVGSETAVITGFEMSADQNVTYVSFYEPAQEGKNGSVWAFDTDKGTVLNKWDNICYKPVKMIYKTK